MPTHRVPLTPAQMQEIQALNIQAQAVTQARDISLRLIALGSVSSELLGKCQLQLNLARSELLLQEPDSDGSP